MSIETHHGLKFHVQELGAGAPVVMLHGLLVGSMTSWYFTAAPAVARSSRVRLYDLRGHGKSERAKTGYDLSTMAGDLESIAAAFSPSEPVSLVGHSYGAAIALHFALRHPERVKKLVLVEAPIPASHLEELESFLGRPAHEMADALPDILKNALSRNGRQATRFLESLRFLAGESSLLADLRRAEDIPDEALRALTCPVLCIYGTDSSCRKSGERLARTLPNARLTMLEGGHFLPVERPQALSDAITEFLHG